MQKTVEMKPKRYRYIKIEWVASIKEVITVKGVKQMLGKVFFKNLPCIDIL